MKKLFATLALAAIALSLGLNPSATAGEKVDLCHFDTDGETAVGYFISVSAKAVDKHLANHGDIYTVDADDLGEGLCAPFDGGPE